MRITAIFVMALTLWTAACGDSPTGPSAGTRVEAIVQDSPSGTATVTGTLAGNVSASVWNGDRWIDLGSANGITIPLQIAGRTTTVHGETSIASSSYSRVRLVFQGVSARVLKGSVVGGTTLANDTTILLGGSDDRAELSVSVSSFSVDTDGRLQTIVFDLHSHQWLTAAAVQSGRVDDAALQAAVTAVTR